MANTHYLHASNLRLVSGLRAIKIHAGLNQGVSDLAVLLGGSEMHGINGPNVQAIWAHPEDKPDVRNGKVHEASILKVKSEKGGTLSLLSSPTGDGKFIVHVETGIPRHWDNDEVARFMQQVDPGQMMSHGSESIDGGSSRIRWQRTQKRIARSVDTFNNDKGVSIFSGDVWYMSPDAEIIVLDITGKAFRIVCKKMVPRWQRLQTTLAVTNILTAIERVARRKGGHASAGATFSEGVLNDAVDEHVVVTSTAATLKKSGRRSRRK